MKYCSYCKADNPAGAIYCHMCGQKLHENIILTYLRKYKGELCCGIGLLGIILLIIGALGFATFTNAILGSIMMVTSIFFLDTETF
jgi:hypothetical protein